MISRIGIAMIIVLTSSMVKAPSNGGKYEISCQRVHGGNQVMSCALHVLVLSFSIYR